MPATASATSALVCYPSRIWARSNAENPRDPAYRWEDHFRSVCRLAREVWKEQPIEIQVAGEREKWFVESLALLTSAQREAFILEMSVTPQPDMMSWLDPSDLPPL